MAGGTSGGGDDDEIITAINVTPLVDVVLVLLIILMVTANYLVSKSIELTLPQAVDPPESSPETRQMNVQIDSEGRLFIDAEPADDATLAARARDLVAAAGDQATATITADTHSEHGAVIRVMSILSHENLTHFSFNVDPTALPPPR
jgi:biopolymer transport protein ExbD